MKIIFDINREKSPAEPSDSSVLRSLMASIFNALCAEDIYLSVNMSINFNDERMRLNLQDRVAPNIEGISRFSRISMKDVDTMAATPQYIFRLSMILDCKDKREQAELITRLLVCINNIPLTSDSAKVVDSYSPESTTAQIIYDIDETEASMEGLVESIEKLTDQLRKMYRKIDARIMDRLTR